LQTKAAFQNAAPAAVPGIPESPDSRCEKSGILSECGGRSLPLRGKIGKEADPDAKIPPNNAPPPNPSAALSFYTSRKNGTFYTQSTL
jgi:hypothetical protein